MRSVSGGRYHVLSEHELARIHEAALDVLTRVGVQVESEPFLTILSDAGCKVEKDGRVMISPQVVADALEKVPNRVDLQGKRINAERFLCPHAIFTGASNPGTRRL